jgi:hydroxypyruvate isomerase
MTAAGPYPCSANIHFLFGGRPLADQLRAAAEAGFRTVELTDPYQLPVAELGALVDELGLEVDLFNLPFGDMAAGDRGYAGDPARQARFHQDVERSIELAGRLRARKVNALAGVRVAGSSEADQLACLRDNLAFAAERFAAAGTRVVTELLNPVETPGFLLGSITQAREVLEPLAGAAGFQLDVYHLQRTRGEVIPAIRAMADLTWHVQIADAPWRTEPGTGELNIPNLLAEILAAGYDGPIGLEYKPSGRGDPFAWMVAAGAVKV